jgi:acetolactate synthase-1/2/3 large subunit
MNETAAMNGAEWLARALAGTGMSHVFFVESTLRRTLLHLRELGVRPILAHSEKAAAYMADGYARVAGRPGVCMAQSVGAANLAAGLQDAWLGRSPVIAFSGRKEPSLQHRNAYQEIPHAPLFAAVTKFSSPIESTTDLPRLLRRPGARPWPRRHGRRISMSTAFKVRSSSSARRTNRRRSRPKRGGCRCTARWPMRATSNARQSS